MKNKKLIISIVVIVILLIGSYFFFFKQDKNSTLTLAEKKWIESNKNDVIDIGVLNDVPVFNQEGKGLFLDFLNDIEENTGLEFNKIAYDKTQSNNEEYRFDITNKATKNDIVIYKDNYVLVGKETSKYTYIDSLPQMLIGVVGNDLENVNMYLNRSSKFTFKTYENYEQLFDSIKKDEVKMIAVPKNLYLKESLQNNLNINYQITDYTKDYVLHLGKNKTLNKIINKYYEKWKNESYKSSYGEQFSESYFKFKNISEKEKSSFRSKRYSYGFVSNTPFDYTYAGKLKGINKEYIKSFSELSGIEIKYTEYSNINDMVKAFNENKIDFMFNNMNVSKYDIDTYDTVNNIENKVAIVTNYKNSIRINSIYSLKGKEVLAIKNTKIETYLKEKEVKVKTFDSINDLLNAVNENSIIAVDLYTYNYYVNNDLKGFRLAYSFLLNKNYGYVIRDIKENKTFEEFFSFYISFTSEKEISDITMMELLKNNDGLTNFFNILLYIGATIGVFAIVKGIIKIFVKPKKENNNYNSKDAKLKYIDHLTSLKNRLYLNDNIEKWDESEVYPQAVLILDLNNIAYINDNFGHKEGDRVIASAANILIQNQIINSEIIRTNGNEFLIYLVGYNEKQIISYIRKLHKEFKELEHGFGVAIGYSMIVDAIKTVDDAINEATLDMKTNKEENNN